MIYYNATADNVSLLLANRFRQVSLNTDQGRKLLAALRKDPQDHDEIATLANVVLYVTKVTEGRVQICSDDQIRIDKRVVDYGMREMILRVLSEVGEVAILSKFLENVDENPNKGIAEHIYSFISKGGMPLTEDGCFLAFKRVQEDYTSFHSGDEDVSITNSIGETTTFKGNIPHWIGATLVMERALCDDNRNRTCSVGLHACSYAYLPQYCSSRGRIMIVKINPRDVVAIPNDYNDTKLRCCRLFVVGQVEEDAAQTHFTSAVDTRYTDSSVEDNEQEVEKELELEEVQRNAVADAKYDYDVTNLNDFDPTQGETYDETPDLFRAIYRIAYTISFVDECEVGEFYSEKAYKLGLDDGTELALHHRNNAPVVKSYPDPVSRSAFMPDFEDGSNYYNVPGAHEDIYIVGFLRGYLGAWGLWKESV